MMNLTNRNRFFALEDARKFRILIFFISLLLLAGNAPPIWAANGEGPLSVAKALPVGIDNFGQVDSHLYRGAQPEIAGYAELKKMGVDTVVRLNAEGQDVAVEQHQVESQGMKFVSLPWNGYSEPTHEQVVAFLDLLRDNADGKTFVHCRLGADRTGVMVALYRITFSHWTTAQATEEMKVFHYHHFFLPHLQHYVESFPAIMASDKDLVQFEKLPAVSFSR